MIESIPQYNQNVYTNRNNKAPKVYFGAKKDVLIKTSVEQKAKEKKEYIQNSRLLSLYNDTSESTYIFCSEENYNYYLNRYSKERLNVLDDMDIDEVKELGKICEDIEKRCIEIGKGNYAKTAIKFLVDLRHYNPEAYQYALNSDFILDGFIIRSDSSYSCLKNLNTAALKEIEKGELNSLTNSYIKNSDKFIKDEENQIMLEEYLSKNQTTAPIKVWRAERESGVFNDIKLEDKALISEIKLTNIIKQLETKSARFSGYKKSYIASNFLGETTIYDHIKDTKDITLADAMLMMPYLRKNAQNKVLKTLKGIKIKDSRFKSTTLSEEFADKWLSSSLNLNSQTKIKNLITVEPGTSGRFIISKSKYRFGDNGQQEFIINNNKKEITINNVDYNPETNTFELESSLKEVNQKNHKSEKIDSDLLKLLSP